MALVCLLLTLDVAAECPAAEEGAGTIESAVIRVATLNVAHWRTRPATTQHSESEINAWGFGAPSDVEVGGNDAINQVLL